MTAWKKGYQYGMTLLVPADKPQIQAWMLSDV